MHKIKQLREQKLPLIARDAELAAENPGIQYRYGLALCLAGKIDKALEQLELAVQLVPQVRDFRQARDLLLQRINQDRQQQNQKLQAKKPNRSTPSVRSPAGKSGGD